MDMPLAYRAAGRSIKVKYVEEPIPSDAKRQFGEALRTSLAEGTLVKLTLGKYRGAEDLTQIVAARVTAKGESQVRLLFKHPTRDITKVLPAEEAVEQLLGLLGSEFMSGNLFTTAADVALAYNRRREPRLHTSRPTFSEAPSSEHNRPKRHLVQAAAPYLKHLGVTDHAGRVKPTMSAKFKQICKFVEIIDAQLRAAPLGERSVLRIADIGSGKGYLTFALYDHLTRQMQLDAKVVGIEQRDDLVRLCNQVSEQSALSGLRFQTSRAEEAGLERLDVLIALHACNTATDAAIFQGVRHGAALIVCAPCCHQELAPQLAIANAELAPLARFGLMKQRQAELVTDTARALLLEAVGYKVNVFEFISTEHTDKNVMIAAVKSDHANAAAALASYAGLKSCFGFQLQKLELLLREAGLLPQVS